MERKQERWIKISIILLRLLTVVLRSFWLIPRTVRAEFLSGTETKISRGKLFKGNEEDLQIVIQSDGWDVLF